MTADLSLDTATDDDLLARVAAGQAEAFAALFRRRQAGVYRFALHMTGIPAVAEDVTQEVFLAVMRDAGRYERGRSVAAWLCGIARNHALRRLQKDRTVVPLDDDAEDLGPHAPDADPLADLTRAEGIDALRRAVLGLPVQYREAVVLCDLQEMSYIDAAVALGCAVGTVRSRLHRGRRLLAGRLRQPDAVAEPAAPRGLATRAIRGIA
jgi:RNA polymerase sigma-70 factor (ECF subfamily)